MGYAFYRISKKNNDIGFQDYLIDSVFHSKKIEIPNDISSSDEDSIIIKSPIVSTENIPKKKVQQEDPLASYIPPTLE